MEEEKPKESPELDHTNTLKILADLKAAIEDMPDDPYLKNALEMTKIVQHS